MFSDNKYRIGRESSLLTLFKKLILTFFNYCYLGEFPYYQASRKLSKGILFLSAPAIITGCSKSVFPQTDTALPTHTCSKSISQLTVQGYGSTLDILTFNDDRLQRLDSYQRVENFDGNVAFAESMEGDKIFFLYSGTQKDRYSWAEICSYSSLRKITCDLERENREIPSMTGLCRHKAGSPGAELDMTPLTCEVVLKSLKCDFSDRAYSGKEISNVKVYLTNINATSSLLPEASGSRTRLINAGMLNPSDVAGFDDRSLVVRNVKDNITSKTQHLNISLLCYPNFEDKSRSARLVIEGIIDGHLYYWPIEINSGTSLERGCRYTYNVTITRKGVTDPESILEPMTAEIKFDIKQWQEREEYQVGF